MTKEDLIAMAKESGFDVIEGPAEWLAHPNRIKDRISVEEYSVGDMLMKFASLVAAQAAAEEREACARMADEFATWGGSNFCDWFKKLAAAIRSRK